jgi:hypothetical protein
MRLLVNFFLIAALGLSIASCDKNGEKGDKKLYDENASANIKEAPKATGVTKIEFAEPKYNFGTIKEGEMATHNFKFKNVGEHPLIISDAKGSCGCTVPNWPTEPILPGKEGEIKVQFNSAGKEGEQSKTVTITANTEPPNSQIVIEGKVEKKK